MKIVITGASGFVGQQLIPVLAGMNTTLLLVGRDPAALRRLFPDCAACNYAELAEQAVGFDLLVHLAVINSDARLSLDATRHINVGLLKSVVESAKRAGLPRMVNISSIHALRADAGSAYAKTKREAAEWLCTVTEPQTVTAFLPPVYGTRWSGKLGFLNRLPRWFARPLFAVAGALTPTVSIDRLAAFLLAMPPTYTEPSFIVSDGQQRNPVYSALKRILDLTFAVAIIAVLWWLLAIIWMLVRLESPGPGLFAQPRVGQDGKIFTCYKFRTMKLGTAQAATNEIPASAVTRTGQFLRRTKLDELPQVWNILRNELSLVGPRPCLPVQRRLIEERMHRGVLALKPGITGLSQSNGIDMSDPEKLALNDARYLALQSLLLDMQIIIATAAGQGQGDRVFKSN